jgi:hypothetical protein
MGRQAAMASTVVSSCQALSTFFAVACIIVMSIPSATGTDLNHLFRLHHKPGPEDPGSLKGNDDYSGYYHGHGNKPASV